MAPNGDLYVADTGNHRIRLVKDGAVSTYAGAGFAGHLDNLDGSQAYIKAPVALALDSASGTLYVSDGMNRIRAVSRRRCKLTVCV